MEVDADCYNTGASEKPAFPNPSVDWNPQPSVCLFPSVTPCCASGVEPDDVAKMQELYKVTPRRFVERTFTELLGAIKVAMVLDFNDFVFTSRITTDMMVLKVKIQLDRRNLASDVKNYDPWSEKWLPHISRLVDCVVVKRMIDGGDLYAAAITKQFRQLALNETEEMNKESTNGLKQVLMSEEEEGF
jgi:hypothetical protein